MKEKNVMVTPIFIAVVTLLAIGAVGELFSTLIAKIKSFATSNNKAYNKELEVAHQLQK